MIETMLILVSIGVGFAAAEFDDYREDRELAAVVLRNVRAEVEANAALLDSLVVQHRTWADALGEVDLARAGGSAYETLFVTRPDAGVTIGVPLKSAAWNTAVSTGALRLLEYDIAAAFSEIYGYQELMTENHNRFVASALYDRAAFDPATQRATVRLMHGIMSEIAGNEQVLLDLYRKHLPLLREATKD